MTSSHGNLDYLFHPRSVALVGITTSNPRHWTRSFLEGYLKFEFASQGALYLVNPKGGNVEGCHVYSSLKDIPDTIDFVVGLVPARVGPSLVDEAASKGAKAVHFCTAGFSEVAEVEGARLQAELLRIARSRNLRIIGPNCLGIYCPESRMSFSALFPRESGEVAFISQSGGNSNYLIRQAGLRGIRFSKVISIGNACDLNESDFLEYLAGDSKTKIIALYVEGVKDGSRFRRALELAAKKKTLVLLKGGATEAGTRAVMGHTASLAGSSLVWESLCRQIGIIQVQNLDGMVDGLVTLSFMAIPEGRRALVIGGGGGASVIVADEFERRRIKLPKLPQSVIRELREFSQAEGNFYANPIDYSQSMEAEKMTKALEVLERWGEFDFFVNFTVPSQSVRTKDVGARPFEFSNIGKPAAIVIEPSIVPEDEIRIYDFIKHFVSARYPVYFSFASAATAIDLVLAAKGI